MEPKIFYYTGDLQSYTILPMVSSITIMAIGAAGGKSSSGTGGRGAALQGSFAVKSGNILNILVGGAGCSDDESAGGSGGGGGGFSGGGAGNDYRGGGGGSSFNRDRAGINRAGVGTGNGQVVINFTPSSSC